MPLSLTMSLYTVHKMEDFSLASGKTEYFWPEKKLGCNSEKGCVAAIPAPQHWETDQF